MLDPMYQFFMQFTSSYIMSGKLILYWIKHLQYQIKLIFLGITRENILKLMNGSNYLCRTQKWAPLADLCTIEISQVIFLIIVADLLMSTDDEYRLCTWVSCLTMSLKLQIADNLFTRNYSATKNTKGELMLKFFFCSAKVSNVSLKFVEGKKNIRTNGPLLE